MSPHEDDTVARRLLQFLNWISSDTPTAAKRYLQLHAKVVVFFQNQAGADAERLADKTLDGVAAHLAQGKSIDREKLEGFVFQRARWVRNTYFQEQKKRRGEMPAEVPAPSPPPKSNEELQQRLKDCLQKLNDKDRYLVLNFYAYDGRKRIEHRKNLARRLQMTEETLRVRAHRIRVRLRNCCLGPDT